MAPQSRLLIVERVLPEQVTRRDRESVLLDLQMLAVTGGQERTEPEFRTLLAEAGFSLTAITEELPPHRYRVIDGTPEAGHDPARP
jgi:O-methyltransferase domain